MSLHSVVQVMPEYFSWVDAGLIADAKSSSTAAAVHVFMALPRRSKMVFC